MSNITLERFKLQDLKRLEEIMEKNIEYSGPGKNWKKFLQWNLSHPDDLYWKIMSDDVMVGYVGFAWAKDKETTKDHIYSDKDLFLEIYFHPDHSGKGDGKKAFDLALERAKSIIGGEKKKVYASTYISNTRAREFFKKKCNMVFDYYVPKYRVFVYSCFVYI